SKVEDGTNTDNRTQILAGRKVHPSFSFGKLIQNHFTNLRADKSRPKRHCLEMNVQFRGKPRNILLFGGANKKAAI
ncbi:MAG: hypothetical protein ABGW88_17985, partial [Leeuwenhoekiella sp.]|uniref:hypothetical protein n=1 Tax=Leeuwenhoekiella sp. TaxID=1977054 RepID=UPI003242EAED